jgi:hypothetical protein
MEKLSKKKKGHGRREWLRVRYIETSWGALQGKQKGGDYNYDPRRHGEEAGQVRLEA